MLSRLITIDYHTSDQIISMCEDFAPSLQFSFGLDKVAILLGLCGVESSFGKLNRPKHEEAYAPGGRYFKNLPMQGLYKQYGALASCSWGPWQIMAIKAHELGYEGHPSELHDGRISGPYVVMNLNKIVRDGAESMEHVLDAYNTGSFRVGEPPKEYIAKFWNCYGQVVDKHLNNKEGNDV